MNLCFVQRGFLCPLKHVLVDVAVVAAKHRPQMDIMEVKGVHQCHCIGTNDSQELLHMLVHLGNLGTGQDTSLQEVARVPADAEQGVQEAQVGQDSADSGVTDLGQLGCEQLHYHIVTVGL